METESLRFLRQRARDLSERIASLRARLLPLEEELRQVESGIEAMKKATFPLLPAKGNEASLKAVAHHARLANPDVRHLTMKQMVVKALEEHFKSGATANQLLDFFVRQWGRDDVTRTSLSPQLSRLKAEKKIMLKNKIWCLNDKVDLNTDDQINIKDREDLASQDNTATDK